MFRRKKKSTVQLEPQRKSGWGARIQKLLKNGPGEDLARFLEEVEDTLIEGDIAHYLAMEIVGELRTLYLSGSVFDGEDSAKEQLRSLLRRRIKTTAIEPDPRRLTVFLLFGVNGVGKTTTIARMINYYRNAGFQRFLLGAGDTFRAAAVEQLNHHAANLGVRIVSQSQGADPAAVVYDTVESGVARNEQIVLIDTAGRMHTRDDLVKELSKMSRIVRERAPEADCHKLLVIDATTGQNGFQQAEVFHNSIGVDAVVLAKSDASSGGGVAVTISDRLGLPFLFMGRGERLDDILSFDVELYLDELLSR